MTEPAESDHDVIEFRFGPRSRWEPVPAGYSTATAFALYVNYDLRVNGMVYRRGEGRG